MAMAPSEAESRRGNDRTTNPNHRGQQPIMKLTFPNADLKKLVDDAFAKWPNGHQSLWGQENGQGFWVVGDQGVYLMHNAILPEGEKAFVVYAVECNPETLPFDEWWDTKRATFGGDDGADFIEAEVIFNAASDGCDIEMTFTESEMSILAVMAEGRA
ncbi:DUF3085 domain-containing protein [Ensifer sp. MPMI2T]|nr:DUF3085 domain-containing protein [Ensifer sp. MPMI2T]